MHERLRCDNTACEYNCIDQQLCTAKIVYYTRKRCITFKPMSREPSTGELMRAQVPGCRKGGRGWKSNRIKGVLK
jgi:hypothetical protein